MTRTHVRCMLRRDLGEVLAIEGLCFEHSLTEDDILGLLRQRNHIPYVAEYGERIVGFMIYELHKYRIHVAEFAVHPEFHRRSVGRQMANKLIGKLSLHRRSRITLSVHEENLSGQLFWRAMGFRAVGVLHGEHGTGDAYAMQYTLDEEASETRPVHTAREC